ncbi:hypothetical protein ACFFRE_03290 [Aciditerrimonas ferrireducens]|uniref:Flp pilus-assembly TadG-like N-terminal domain-containing protein n=1 Tax=Aciditerrimonas ferrireducens TaxID=667306 RepID=A0ABV6C0H3_9ACTN
MSQRHLLRRGLGHRGRWPTGRPGQDGQALAIVLGLVGLLTIGGLALAQASLGGGPVLTQGTLAEQAHEAAMAGVDDYLAAVNANPDEVVCSTANETSGFCSGGPAFESWQALSDQAPGAVPSWFWLSDPAVDQATGQVAVTVVGAAGDLSARHVAYEQAQVALRATNDFLRDLLWLDYDQIDPLLLDPQGTTEDPGPTCGLYWQDYGVNEWTGQSEPKTSNTLGPSSSCTDVAFVTGDVLDGPVFVKDAIFVCGSPTFTEVHTEDPDLPPGTFTVSAGSGCPNAPQIQDPAASTTGTNTPDETVPPTNATLLQVAERLGCVYEGPTELSFATTQRGTVMAVTSPDTPGLGTKSGSNDALDAPANPNRCLPSHAGGTIPAPANGVVYVQDCPAQDQACTFDPLAGTGQPGSIGPTEGDAIVQGTVGTPLTVAAENNVVIDGNLCYPSTTGSCPTVPSQIAPLPGLPPPILGLIAQNFVVLNHPVEVVQSFFGPLSFNAPICGTRHAPAPPHCDLENPVVDAVSLSLTHSFVVANWSDGQPLGTLSVLGAIAQNWRGPVGTYTGNSQIASGYLKNYVWDTRLTTLAPPYYLNPGTASWTLASLSLQPTLTCQVAGCSPLPRQT